MPPTEVAGLSLLILAGLLLLLELKVSGFGILGISGLLAFIAGFILLFGLNPISFPILLASSAILILFFGIMSYLTYKAKKNKVVTGESGMIGLEGRAETSLLPEGKVSVRGELWDAWSPVRIEQGEQVRIVGIRGLRLEVTSASADRQPGQPLSQYVEREGPKQIE